MIEFDCVTIEVISMEHLAIIEDPRYSTKQAHRLNPLPNPEVSGEGDFDGGIVPKVKLKSKLKSKILSIRTSV
jgi:DNA polymerase-3 subunit alpha